MTKKVFKAFLAVIPAVFILLFNCITVQAAVRLKDAVLDNGTLYISGSVDTLGIDPQLTVTVTPLVRGTCDLNNIIYIGQQPISGSIFTLEFPLTLDDGFYAARIGGSDIDEPRFIIINRRGSEYSLLLGDVDQSGTIDASDSALTLQYVLAPDKLALSALQLYAANAENGSTITASSAAWILSKTLNETVKFPAEY